MQDTGFVYTLVELKMSLCNNLEGSEYEHDHLKKRGTASLFSRVTALPAAIDDMISYAHTYKQHKTSVQHVRNLIKDYKTCNTWNR